MCIRVHELLYDHKVADMTVLVVLVLGQLAVATGQQVAGLTEQLQGLLLVDVAEHGPLSGRFTGLWEPTETWVRTFRSYGYSSL